MFKQKPFQLSIILVILALVLAACGGSEESAAPAEAQEAAAEAPAEVAAEPTNTPVPPTNTPAPTPTPAPPTPTPAPEVELESGVHVYTNGNYVRDIAVLDGVLWAATGGGIVSWDIESGESLARYTTLDGLPTNDMDAIVACPIPEPSIIAGSEFGLSIYDPATESWTLMNSENSGMERDGVDELDCQAQSHTLLIGYTFDFGVYNADTDNWQYFDEDKGLATSFVSQSAVVGDDIWVVAPFGVSVIGADGNVTAYTEDLENIVEENVESVAADADGNVWLAAFDGLMKYRDGEFTLYNSDTVENFPFLDAYEGVVVAPDGTVWVGNTFGAICQFDPAAETCLEIYEDQAGMVGDLNHLIMDDQGNIYYSDDGEGVSMFDGSRWRAFTLDDLPKSNAYNAIAQSPDGTVWLGGDFGLQQFNLYDAEGEWVEVDLEGFGVNTFYPTEEGMWVGHNGGASFYQYQSDSWTHLQKSEEAGAGIYDGGVSAITMDNAGRMWFGTWRGLTVWDGAEAFTYYNLLNEEEIEEEKSPKSINALHFDGSNVWVGTSGALFQFDENDEITRWDDNLEGLLSLFAPSISAFAHDPSGNMLLAIDSALVSYDGNNFSDVYEADSRIETILTRDNGEIWLGLDGGGAAHFDGSQWTQLTTADGLPSNDFGKQSILVDSLDTTWFAAQEGGLIRLVP